MFDLSHDKLYDTYVLKGSPYVGNHTVSATSLSILGTTTMSTPGASSDDHRVVARVKVSVSGLYTLAPGESLPASSSTLTLRLHKPANKL